MKFRYNAALTIAAVVAAIGAVPLAATRWYLAPVFLVPVLVAFWAWRAGTDADRDGVRVRALAGSRFLPWTGVDTLLVGERSRVYARTAAGGHVRLTAVAAADLPRLIAASGQRLTGVDGPAAPADGQTG